MTAIVRLLSNFGLSLIIILGISLCPANAVPHENTALVKAGVEQAFSEQGRVRVLIKLKETPPSSAHLADRRRIKYLHSKFMASMSNEAQEGDIRITRQMQRIPWVSAKISHKALEKLRHHPQVAMVEQDIPIHASLAESAPQINADRSYHTGYTGMGINVAILDTGIDTDHPDLMDSLIWEECFLSEDPCPVSGTNRASGPGTAEDNNGHGSHVSGIITSDNEIFRGIAPEAGIVAIKILDSGGNGELSDLVAALDWVADNHAAYDIRIVNMSVGSFVYQGACDLQNQSVAEAADAVKDAGVASVAASGNDGAEYRIDAPACLSAVISVGAVYDANVGQRTYSKCIDVTTAQDQIVCFSNVSTVLDLLAPGARITSSSRYGGTTVKDGTSMACPHAAGMAALLLEVDASLSPDDLFTIMSTTGTLIYDDRIDLWFPRLNIAAALGIDVAADPLVHDFDYVAPQEHSLPEQFTISNTGIDDILLGSISMAGDHPSDYNIVADTCSGAVLPGGGDCTLTAQFAPTAAGTRRASLLIPTDEPEAPQLVIELKGWSGQAYFVNDASATNDIWATTAGNDSNDGLTPDTPKASVQSVLSDYDLEPGDVVRIDTGIYLLESNIDILAEGGGDRDHPVAFMASPYGVTIDRGDQALGSYTWFLNQCDYLTLTTVDDDTYPAAEKQWMSVMGGSIGIYLYESSYIQISRIAFHENSLRDITTIRSYRSTFTNNLFSSSNAYGLFLGASDYATIINNTLVGEKIYAIRLDGSTNHAVLKNNIILASGTGSSCIYASDSASIDASDYNLLLPTSGATIGYYDSWATDLSEWQAITGLDAHSISSDPLFKDPLLFDYHLNQGSPAIDAGDPASDYTDESQPNGGRINLGAFGGTPEAAVSKSGDLDGDGDVDGSDLAALAGNLLTMDLSEFALHFGKIGCESVDCF